MIGYLILAICIIGVSVWLSVRSLQRERLLSGFETYTTIEVIPALLSEKFFCSLFEKLTKKHSAASLTVLTVVRQNATATYLRTPTWLLAWIAKGSPIKHAPSFEKILGQQERSCVLKLAPCQAVRQTGDPIGMLAARLLPSESLVFMNTLRITTSIFHTRYGTGPSFEAQIQTFGLGSAMTRERVRALCSATAFEPTDLTPVVTPSQMGALYEYSPKASMFWGEIVLPIPSNQIVN